MNSFVLCGMQWGDEGKGVFTDYLAHKENVDAVVRYNGGSQASHTVITPDGILHKFSQLGSGMFLKTCETYLTENMVINLDSLMVELEVFSEKTKISIRDLISRIHIHENCFVVTPYHKLMNKLRELSKGENRRGSVGTGVSEVRYFLSDQKKFPFSPPLGLQVKDIFNEYSNNPIIGRLEALQEYVNDFYITNKEVIYKNLPDNIKGSLEKEINYLLSPRGYMGVASHYITDIKRAKETLNLKRCIYKTYEQTMRKNVKIAVFEGSQGLLLDGTYGIKPNTTFLDTTNHYALDISYYRDNIKVIGLAKAFLSRHGMGIFPTETDEVSSKIVDPNQEETYWNGKIRFGWFDAVLLRYAQKINQVEELYLSALDKLDAFEKIKVCNEYIYTDAIDEAFEETFKYEERDGDVVIKNIITNHQNLSDYLSKCIPCYIEVDGWNEDISKTKDYDRLPQKCREYISLLQNLVDIPITLISVGPTRNEKIELVKR